MLSLFSRHPRTVRSRGRTRLRLEPLEARANPAAPVLTDVSADWSGGNHVVVLSGMIQDETPAGTYLQVGGAAIGDFQVAETGEFTVVLKLDAPGTVYFRAMDAEGLMSTASSAAAGQKIMSESGRPSLQDVDIYHDEDGWHIRGRLDGCDPIGSIIRIIKGPGDSSGQTEGVNEDGTFDIIISTNPDDPGGAISIIGVGGDGTEADPWDGYVG